MYTGLNLEPSSSIVDTRLNGGFILTNIYILTRLLTLFAKSVPNRGRKSGVRRHLGGAYLHMHTSLQLRISYTHICRSSNMAPITNPINGSQQSSLYINICDYTYPKQYTHICRFPNMVPILTHHPKLAVQYIDVSVYTAYCSTTYDI